MVPSAGVDVAARAWVPAIVSPLAIADRPTARVAVGAVSRAQAAIAVVIVRIGCLRSLVGGGLSTAVRVPAQQFSRPAKSPPKRTRQAAAPHMGLVSAAAPLLAAILENNLA